MGLIDEIREQPEVVERLLDDGPRVLGPVVDDVRDAGIEHVVVAARGSSDHAGIYAVYALGSVARMPVALAAPSLFSRYDRPPRVRSALVIGISQSGRSPDIVGVLEEATRQGAVTLAITNDPNSPLAGAARHVLDLAAGPERSVAATKTYTAQLTAIAVLAAALGELDRDEWRSMRSLPRVLAAALDVAPVAEEIAARHADLGGAVVLGRGFHLASAFEWALKLKELAGVAAQAYSSADYEHGPIASFPDGGHLLAVRARGPMAEEIDRVVERIVRERRARAILVTDGPSAGVDRLPFPDRLPEWLSPIVAAVPMQLFAAGLTVAKGLDPERPRGLSKVTLTR